MIIANSSVQLSAQHRAESQTEVRERLHAWVGSRSDGQATGTSTSFSAAALAELKAHPPQLAAAIAADEAQTVQDAIDAANEDPTLILIRLLVEMITGYKIGAVKIAKPSSSPTTPAKTQQAQSTATPKAEAGFGLEYEKRTFYRESEQTHIAASGTVTTSDGRQIGFRLDLLLQRSFQQETSTSVRLADAVQKDPLVVNFGTDSANLTGQRFAFKFEAGGNTVQVPMLGAGSGFLALDRDDNGSIDAGQELFGAASGNGFADLAAFDADGNGWIDEADPVFNRLRIWLPAADGNGQLLSLRDKNVGALGLVHTTTPFQIKDAANQSLGTLRATGVYLSEDGSAGTLQQLDLTV